MQAYFGWAKPSSCLHCCSPHLFVSGRLGRVEIVTLRAGARAKGGKGGRGAKERKNVRRFLFSLPAPFDSPHFLLSSGSFNMALSRARLLARPKKTPALQATVVKANHFQAFSNWHLPNVSQMVRNHFRCKVARFSLLHFFHRWFSIWPLLLPQFLTFLKGC